MASSVTPASVQLLHTVTEQLGKWADHNDPILLTQILLLGSVTMFEGVGTPSVMGIQTTPTTITIRWEGASSDTITWGVMDDASIRFAHYIARRVLSIAPQQDRTGLPETLFHHLQTRLSYYLSALEVTERRLTALMAADIKRTFDGGVEPVFLFVLLGCLPLDQLNALFLYVQQFLPEELTVSTVTGKPLNIANLFQPAADVRFMVEKVNMYLDLYMSPQMPIIREITQSKTRAYFEKLMLNPAVRDGLIQNLQGILDYQISPRKQLYTLLIRILKKGAPL